LTDTEQPSQQKRERSPNFPYIGLGKALERTKVIFDKAKRHEVRVADIAGDWGLKATSGSTDRNVAALLAYGLIEDVGGGDSRKIKISESGWRILEDGRPGVREKMLAEAALKPTIIQQYASLWGEGRPDDTHALSQLKFEGKFTSEGASQFLRVFDETIRFTKGIEPDKIVDTEDTEGQQNGAGDEVTLEPPIDKKAPLPTPPQRKVTVMAGERELTTGLLAKGASFRLIVSGVIGVKEIERLIQKLEIDKDILADQNGPSDDDIADANQRDRSGHAK
jgi:hypothetical protein